MHHSGGPVPEIRHSQFRRDFREKIDKDLQFLTGLHLNHLMIWQGMGMVIGVYGLGYWWAAEDPIRHWPIVAVGFLGKLFGPLGFAMNFLSGDAPWEFFYTLITNDFIWWIPFFLILREAYRKHKLVLSDA